MVAVLGKGGGSSMMTSLIKNTAHLSYMRRESLRVAGPSAELAGYIHENRLDLATGVAHAGYINLAIASFQGDTFRFDQDGEPAVVIEALLFDDTREEFTADLVAWPVEEPGAFVTAMGTNDGADVLGAVHMVQRAGAPLRVHRTPLAWLQADCEGCVPLKSGARHWLHAAGGPFLAEDADHGRELRHLLGPSGPRCQILVPRGRVAA